MKFVKMVLTFVVVLVWVCAVFAAEPVNPNASPEARQLLNYLYEVSGKYIIAGNHNHPGHHNSMTERTTEITKKVPAVWGTDFGFTADGKDGINHRPVNMAEAIKQHSEGSIITLMWHAVAPVHDEPHTWRESVWYKFSEEEWNELVTPGTELHNRWLAQLDVVADYLKILRNANIPVLWRPYHEMNGDWFWWCNKKGEKGFKTLWRFMYDRYVNYHELNNLIWVWNTNAPNDSNVGPYVDYFPGHDVVDVLAADIYRSDYKQSHHDDLMKLATGKPIALGEIGGMPDPKIIDTQPGWVWFMVWGELLTSSNTNEQILELYNDPRTLTRDEIKMK